MIVGKLWAGQLAKLKYNYKNGTRTNFGGRIRKTTIVEMARHLRHSRRNNLRPHLLFCIV